jgi:hypothetical protein
VPDPIRPVQSHEQRQATEMLLTELTWAVAAALGSPVRLQLGDTSVFVALRDRDPDLDEIRFVLSPEDLDLMQRGSIDAAALSLIERELGKSV